MMTNKTRLNPLIKNSLICGLSIFAACAFLTFIKAAPVLMLFVIFVPGVLYGLVVATDEDENNKTSHKALFILWSGSLYFGCSFIANIKYESTFAATQVAASVLGAVLLFGGYYLILNRNYRLVPTLLYALFLGAIAAMPTSLIFYYRDRFDSDIVWYSIFFIFPIWQTAFSILLIKCKIKTVVDERI